MKGLPIAIGHKWYHKYVSTEGNKFIVKIVFDLNVNIYQIKRKGIRRGKYSRKDRGHTVIKGIYLSIL